MSRPPRICSCGETVEHGVFCVCQRKAKHERDARFDATRPPSSVRYPAGWRKARAEYLATHPHCRECSSHGVTTLASVVDHILPHKRDTRLFWSRANWQPLCAPCHNSTKQRKERAP
jgi:5-methylcytosine-specific restriction protein A